MPTNIYGGKYKKLNSGYLWGARLEDLLFMSLSMYCLKCLCDGWMGIKRDDSDLEDITAHEGDRIIIRVWYKLRIILLQSSLNSSLKEIKEEEEFKLGVGELRGGAFCFVPVTEEVLIPRWIPAQAHISTWAQKPCVLSVMLVSSRSSSATGALWLTLPPYSWLYFICFQPGCWILLTRSTDTFPVPKV